MMNIRIGFQGMVVALVMLLCSACMPKHCVTSCTDSEINTHVINLMQGDRCLSYQYIDVSTYERVVTLEGAVANPSQARLAVDLARSVPRVRAVVSHLHIKNKYNGWFPQWFPVIK